LLIVTRHWVAALVCKVIAFNITFMQRLLKPEI
jgi:hypothetical protein